MADFTTLRQVVKGRYGLDRSTTADALFTDTILGDLINEAHRWLAREAWLYYEMDRTETLVNGTKRYALDTDVIRVDPTTIRQVVGGTYSTLLPRNEAALRYDVGPLESVSTGTATGFWLNQGELTNDETVVISLHPTPNAAGTLLYSAWVYPADLSADGDRPKLQASEHDRLVIVTCWKMSEVELSRGRENAPVAYWQPLAQRAAAELAATRKKPTGLRVDGVPSRVAA